MNFLNPPLVGEPLETNWGSYSSRYFQYSPYESDQRMPLAPNQMQGNMPPSFMMGYPGFGYPYFGQTPSTDTKWQLLLLAGIAALVIYLVAKSGKKEAKHNPDTCPHCQGGHVYIPVSAPAAERSYVHSAAPAAAPVLAAVPARPRRTATGKQRKLRAIARQRRRTSTGQFASGWKRGR